MKANTVQMYLCITYERLTQYSIFLSLFWLTCLSFILPHRGNDVEVKLQTPLTQICIFIMLLLWSYFLFEFILYVSSIWKTKLFWKKFFHGIVVVLFPCFRISIPSLENPTHFWIPWMGFRERSKELNKKLEHIFSLPMIFFALMILPILAIEWQKSEWIDKYQSIHIALDLGTQLIWLAFTIEFIVMISVNEKKLVYCIKNWIDLAIILLPIILFLIPFFSFLPAARLLRLGRLSNISRAYRVKGLGMRAYQALIILSASQRFSKRLLRNRLETLKEKREQKMEEIQELIQEIKEIELELGNIEKEK